jgi:hypothetical protein
VVGYVFAIRSERALCRDVQVNLAYRWFCGAISRQAIDSGLIPGTAPRAVLLKYGTDSRIIIHRALPLLPLAWGASLHRMWYHAR